jgi:AcrR family transcriptional regulator
VARARKTDAGARRQAILEAALTVFAEHGYEAARLDDVARRAGVAKGTLYLYFNDKEALFESLIRSAIDPVLERLKTVSAVPDLPLSQVLEGLFSVFRSEVLGSASSCSASSSPKVRASPRSPSSTIATL